MSKTTVVAIKLTSAEIDALDALGRYIGCVSRSDTIRTALARLKPTFTANPFCDPLVRASRRRVGRRRSTKQLAMERVLRRQKQPQC